MPLHGARIAASLRGVPSAAADAIRWHREHDDGTGVPDGLRWDGIPSAAATIGIAHAFVAAVDDPAEPRDPFEALFALTAEGGRRFSLDVARAFGAFVADSRTSTHRVRSRCPPSTTTPRWRRSPSRSTSAMKRTRGRSARLAARASALAERLALDAHRASRCARLLALGRAAESVPGETFDPLSRFAREQRTALASRAAALAASVPRYAGEASTLVASAAWYEDGVRDVYGALLATIVAADGLDAVDAPRRLAAAAGSQLDPDVARAYVSALGAPT